MEQILSNFEQRVNPKIEQEKQEKEKELNVQIQNSIKCHCNQLFNSILIIFCSLVMFIVSCRIEFLIITNRLQGASINDLPIEIALSCFTFIGTKFCIIVTPILAIGFIIYSLRKFKTLNNLNDRLENKVILTDCLYLWLKT